MSYDNSWVLDTQQKIFSRLSAVCQARLGTKYADLRVTMDSHTPTTPKFPSIYVFFMAREVGQDLVGRDMNAVYLTAEIEITVTEAQGVVVANEVSQVVVDCMKEMRFPTDQIPEFRDTDTEYRTVSRFARYIGNSDVLYDA